MVLVKALRCCTKFPVTTRRESCGVAVQINQLRDGAPWSGGLIRRYVAGDVAVGRDTSTVPTAADVRPSSAACRADTRLNAAAMEISSPRLGRGLCRRYFEIGHSPTDFCDAWLTGSGRDRLFPDLAAS